jgi:uncharacterized SAM-binding protein YcdF (DUF218 family)
MKQLQSKGTRKRTLFWLGALLPFFVLLPIPLVVQDDVHQADAIVIIGGDHKPERIERAVELYRGGYAPVVVISAGTIVQEGSTLVPEAEVMRRQALALGLPEEAILLETRSQSTIENAQHSREFCRERGNDLILLVTSAYHSRRARRIFRETLGPDLAVSVQPAPQGHHPLLWWLYPDQAAVVFYEYRNWAQYWIARLAAGFAPMVDSETIYSRYIQRQGGNNG